MNRLIFTIVIMSVAATQTHAAKAHLDGKQPMFCTAVQFYECDLGYGCLQVDQEDIGAAGAWKVDFKKKVLTPAIEGAAANPIRHSEVLDGKIFMTSVQDGLADETDGVAWSVSVNTMDGLMTIMVAGDGVGFVGLGSCVPSGS